MDDHQNDWTPHQVMVYVERIMGETDKRNQERFRSSEIAVNTAMTAAEKAVNAALAAAKEAVVKAEAATERRLEALNELRSVVNDAVSLKFDKTEANLRFQTIDDKIADLARSRDTGTGGVTASQRFTTVFLAIASLVVSAGAIIAIILLHGH
jgi:hypothetical protein